MDMKKIWVVIMLGFASCQTPPAPSDAKIGMALWSFNRFSFEEAIPKAAEVGVSFVEGFEGMKLRPTDETIFHHTMSAADQNFVKECLKKSGMQMRSAYVGTPAEAEAWHALFTFAQHMELEYLTVEPMLEHLSLLDSLSQVYKIGIALHNHPEGTSLYWNPDSVKLLVQQHPNLGLCADIGHWARSGLDEVQSLNHFTGKMYGIHFKDIATRTVQGADTIMGHGLLDFNAIKQTLANQQFSGYWIIEREGNWEDNIADIQTGLQLLNN
jgi:sugar phosphate isomerase/epimerase